MPSQSGPGATVAPAAPRGRRWWRVGALLALLGTGAVASLALSQRLGADPSDRSPMEVVRYLEQQLAGHPGLEGLAAPVFSVVRGLEQREAPQGLPNLGKGQQAYTLPAPLYDAGGRPQPVAGQRAAIQRGLTRTLSSLEALASAMDSAKPGDVLELAPGTYKLSQTLVTRSAGAANSPIVVRAAVPGKVVIESNTVQAVLVSQPFWLFENLEFHGVCAQHDECEHAFHVVGGARSTVLLNNRLVDFNSAVKVNGEGGQWPDDGLLQFNTLTATAPRRTQAPVSVLDLVSASGWRVMDNHVERFVKDGGNRISYGLCVKGGGQRVRVERNLVVCTPEAVWQPGARVGISLGCGLTGEAYCRDGKACESEHSEGQVANNVIAHCNDFGIDLNRVRAATVSQNTLVNTAGIDLRHAATTAESFGNLLEGRERARDGAQLQPHGDLVVRRLSDLMTDPESLDLRWRGLPESLRPTPENRLDFCAQPRPVASPPGATMRARCDRP